MRFKNKNVVVTGGSKGLGLEICQQFINEGANVSFCGREKLAIENANVLLSKNLVENQKLFAKDVDISDFNSVEKYLEQTNNDLGEIDILVSNAGIVGSKGLIENADVDEWTKSIHINLCASFYLLKLLLPQMKNNNFGRIVILSGGGATKPMSTMSAYSASKAGLVRLAETAATECENYDIKINCLAPGALNTAILEELLNNKENLNKDIYDNCMKQKENGGQSIKNAAATCLKLCENEIKINGKLISAVWDDVDSIYKSEVDKDIFTLRRIT
jgi:NAD(P)-dependent dehydrogenase (short-subunit alcohol dehydrogenase family)